MFTDHAAYLLSIALNSTLIYLIVRRSSKELQVYRKILLLNAGFNLTISTGMLPFCPVCTLDASKTSHGCMFRQLNR